MDEAREEREEAYLSRIRITLTPQQYNAVYLCVRGEVEAVFGDRSHGDYGRHLSASLRAMERGQALAHARIGARNG